MEHLELNKKSLIKPKGTLHISNDLSRMEKLTWNVLLGNCKDKLADRGDFKIDALSLLNHLGLGDTNYSYLKKILKALNGTQVEWNVLGVDRKTEWGVTTLLASAKLKNGVCFFEFSKELRNKIVESELYARIWFHIEKKLKGKHSITIYEFLLAYYNRKEKIGDTPKLSIEDFKKAIGKEGQYKDFKNLKRFVINPSIKDINEKSDIFVTFKTFKTGRKIEEIKFHIKANVQNEQPKTQKLSGKKNPDENLAKVKIWVDEILEFTKHPESEKFYYKIAWKLVLSDNEQLIYQALREIKADFIRDTGIKKNRAALFNSIIQRLAKEKGVDLGLKK